MRNPNGYGNVSKLNGNRRKPWRARITSDFRFYDRLEQRYIDCMPNPLERLENGNKRYVVRQIYQTLGCYATRQEAMIALAEYNQEPYDLNLNGITLKTLYEEWSKEHYENISKSNIGSCKCAWKVCEPIQDMKISELKLRHFQNLFNNSGKNLPTAKKLKVILGQMYDYAIKHEMIKSDRRNVIKNIDLSRFGNPDAYGHEAFTREEVADLWNYSTVPDISILIIMIYTGVRISELLDLKKSDVHFEERYFGVVKSKTEAGIRDVPIAEKIAPLVEKWLESDCEYLITNHSGGHLTYKNFKKYWKELRLNHTPHDTRHTCISMLTEAGVDDRIIKKIVGHKGYNLTEDVYTHIDMKTKLDAINKI